MACDVIVGVLADGSRMPLADTLLGDVLRAGKTCSWADVRADERIAGIPRVRTMPWRAFISTPFRVGPTVYFLTFASDSALVEPFVPDDHAYLEIVDRLRHESAHDPLTGLANRTAFRVACARVLVSGDVEIATGGIVGAEARRLQELDEDIRSSKPPISPRPAAVTRKGSRTARRSPRTPSPPCSARVKLTRPYPCEIRIRGDSNDSLAWF